MKQIITLISILFCNALPISGQSNFLDKYIGSSVTNTVIASSSDQVSNPVDFDFKENSNELWIANYGNSNGSSMVIVYNAGQTNQKIELRKDSHSGHFMIFPTSIAFGKDGFWASANEIKNTASASSTFMGPALWSADTAIFARVFQNPWTSGFPLGSHYDMLHQSPFAMGIAHDTALGYWVNDGHNGNICYYDFVKHHGPGYDNHSAGKIKRYTDVKVTRVNGIPSHMVVDKENGWLYFIDGGPKKLKRLKLSTGSITGSLTVPSTSPEPLAAYNKVENAIVETIDSFSSQPCGIDYYKNRLIVSDNTNGNIYLYNTTGAITKRDTIVTGVPGMMGVKVGPDGRIWCANKLTSRIYRLDIAKPTVDISILNIASPPVQNFKSNFYSTSFDICSPSINPSITILNSGTSTITSASFQYTIDNASAVMHSWTGSLTAGNTATVSLPNSSINNGNHLIKVTAMTVNGIADEIDLNNSTEGAFRSISPIVNLPLSEDFNSTQFPPSGWNYINYNPNNFMKHSTMGGFGKSIGCLKLDNFSGAEDISGQIDFFITPRINLTNTNASTQFKFSVAYKMYDINSKDKLEVITSSDCGNTWTSIYAAEGDSLKSSNNFETSSFNPTESEWKTVSVDLSSVIGKPDVMFAFKTTSAFGNNIYIDDISIKSSIISNLNSKIDDYLKFSPNPIITNLQIDYFGNEDKKIDGYIYGSDGKLIKSFIIKENQNIFELDCTELKAGIYTINIIIDQIKYFKKVIKD